MSRENIPLKDIEANVPGAITDAIVGTENNGSRSESGGSQELLTSSISSENASAKISPQSSLPNGSRSRDVSITSSRKKTKSSCNQCWLTCLKFIGNKKFRKLIWKGSFLFIILSLIIGIPERVYKIILIVS